jgi:hypothetical protein
MTRARAAVIVLPVIAAFQLPLHAQNPTPPVPFGLPTSSQTCGMTGVSAAGGCGLTATSLIAGANDVTGTGFSGPSPFNTMFPIMNPVPTSSSAGGFLEDISFSTTGLLTGPVGGIVPAGTVIPEYYNFSISDTSATDFVRWTLTYAIIDDSGTVFSDSSITGTTTGTFQGYFFDTLSQPLTVGDTIQVDAGISFVTSDETGEEVSVTVPQGSFDVNADTPEPSTFALVAMPLAAAGIWLGFRRSRTARVGSAR